MHTFLSSLHEREFLQRTAAVLPLLARALIRSTAPASGIGRHKLVDALRSKLASRAAGHAVNPLSEQFLTLVSRELQTSTAVILGWASTIHKRQLRGEELMTAFKAIEQNAHAQNRLVQNLLERSRIINGSCVLARERICLSQVIRTALDEVREVMHCEGTRLALTIKAADYRLTADPVRLQQVFRNLLSNAVTFTPCGGHVSVELSRSGDTATVLIKDDGVGIRPEVLLQIFDGMQWDSRTAAASETRVGLGLWVARHIIERHHGVIRAESDGPGSGATFSVMLPLGPVNC
jgi:signal transduction histidine kinase